MSTKELPVDEEGQGKQDGEKKHPDEKGNHSCGGINHLRSAGRHRRAGLEAGKKSVGEMDGLGCERVAKEEELHEFSRLELLSCFSYSAPWRSFAMEDLSRRGKGDVRPEA